MDSILTARSDGEAEASRRLKTEFLVQFDGVGSAGSDRVLVMAATNLPQALDDAAIRRFPKRILIPQPEVKDRAALITHLLRKVVHELSAGDIRAVASAAEGYSGSDLAALARDAAMGPVRALSPQQIARIREEDMPPVRRADFLQSLKAIRPSTSKASSRELEAWAAAHGTSA